MYSRCQDGVFTEVHAMKAVLSALTSFQFIVIPVASYALLGEEVTCTTLICIAIVLFGAPITHWPISCHCAEACLLSLSLGLQVPRDQQSERWCLTQATV